MTYSSGLTFYQCSAWFFFMPKLLNDPHSFQFALTCICLGKHTCFTTIAAPLIQLQTANHSIPVVPVLCSPISFNFLPGDFVSAASSVRGGGEWLPISWDRLSLRHTEAKDGSCWEIAYPVVFCSSCSPCVRFSACPWTCPKHHLSRCSRYREKTILWTTERKERALQQRQWCVLFVRYIYPTQLDCGWNVIFFFFLKLGVFFMNAAFAAFRASLQAVMWRRLKDSERIQICRFIDRSAVKDPCTITASWLHSGIMGNPVCQQDGGQMWRFTLTH